MDSNILYYVSVIALTIIWLSFQLFRAKLNFKEYFTTNYGKDALGDILQVLALILMTIILGAITGCSGTRGYVFSGLEYPKEQSPQCFAEGPDGKTTSNLGATVERDLADRLTGAIVYRHHSCAFNEDRNVYDALGVELKYRMW